MTDYWKRFWLDYARKNRGADSQIQVLRTLNKQPIQPDVFASILESVIALLTPAPSFTLLDLCCGNGIITRELAPRFSAITAVDLSEEFTSRLSAETGNITAFSADARTVDFPAQSFDRILCYSGLQYFSESETVTLFTNLRHWIREGGLIVLGDIPDASRRWNFFNSPERESAYFEALQRQEPIVGNWYEYGWLEKLSHHAGFKSVKLHPQPRVLPFQHYRFDLVLSA